jgi:hypothetical protein
MLIASTSITEEQARARMSLIQWSALAARMKRKDSLSQLVSLPRFQNFKKSKTCSDVTLKQYLRNGWTTETLLAQNLNSFTGDALKNSLVWAFPQAYYSVFSVTLGYFQVAGFTDGQTHASLIRKFGDEADLGHYPHNISFLVSGGIEHKRTFKNCSKTTLPSSLHFDPLDPDVIDSHLASLLSTTRQADLRDRLLDRKLKTKSGKPKKKFTEGEYASAGVKLGHTSVLSFLYRKRIKSNYQEVDSILSSELKADEIFPRLIRVVACLHMIHEAYIARAIGQKAYTGILDSLPTTIATLPRARFNDIKPNVA